jgi:hypothetical protein
VIGLEAWGLQVIEDLWTDPRNAHWQRDLSVSYERIGVILVVQGYLSSAFMMFRKRHSIAEGLVATDPCNAGWQCDLSLRVWQLPSAWRRKILLTQFINTACEPAATQLARF